MASNEDTTPIIGEDDEKLGRAFYLRLAAILAVVGILVLIGTWIFWRAWYAWGFFGAFIAIAVIAIIAGWLSDRRKKRY